MQNNTQWNEFIETHPRYLNASFNSCDDSLMQLMGAFKIMIQKNDTRGLIISGDPGTGKTYFLMAAINELFINHKMKNDPNHFVYSSEESLFSQLKSLMDYNNSGVETHRIISWMQKCQILFYDDLGASISSERPWGRDVLFQIINHRYENNLTTFLTTNLSSVEMRERIGPRTADRINDMHKVMLGGCSKRGRFWLDEIN